ncbi:MAG: lysylphosphatidylglycerol synthase domain-containing protein, partial [Polyangiaceae bacterium]
MSEWRSRFFVATRGLLAFMLLGYVLWLLVAQLEQTDTTIPTPSPGWLALCTIVMAAYYLLIVENWRMSMGALGAPLGRRHAFHLIYVSNLAKFLPGGLWNFVGRVALCARHGVSATSASASVLLEVIGCTCAMATLSLLTLSSRIEELVH